MGREATCNAVIGKWKGSGKVLLETDDLIFRGEQRLVVPRSGIASAKADDGWLVIKHGKGSARFEVGKGVERWVNDILNPKTLVDKLGVTAESNAAVIGAGDDEFVEQVRARTAHVVSRLGKGPYDLIFYQADKPAALDRLEQLRGRIAQNGAVWIMTPRGVPELGHGPVVSAAKRAGLVDVKNARFSATHTALKLVIPKAERLPG